MEILFAIGAVLFFVIVGLPVISFVLTLAVMLFIYPFYFAGYLFRAFTGRLEEHE